MGLEEKVRKLLKGLIEIHFENYPVDKDDMKDERIRFKGVVLDFIERNSPPFTKVIQRYDSQIRLTGKGIPTYRGKGGVITVFEKAMVLGDPRDAINYYLNKRGRKNKYGPFVGFIYAEIPDIDTVYPITTYLVTEPDIEHRNKIRKWRKKHNIKKLHYDLYLKYNTLIDFNDPEFEPKTPEDRLKEYNERVRLRMEKDENYKIIDDMYKRKGMVS